MAKSELATGGSGGDGKVDIVDFDDDGLWIARNRGDGGFDAAHRRRSTQLPM
jgi:hypothetical protein